MLFCIEGWSAPLSHCCQGAVCAPQRKQRTKKRVTKRPPEDQRDNSTEAAGRRNASRSQTLGSQRREDETCWTAEQLHSEGAERREQVSNHLDVCRSRLQRSLQRTEPAADPGLRVDPVRRISRGEAPVLGEALRLKTPAGIVPT